MKGIKTMVNRINYRDFVIITNHINIEVWWKGEKIKAFSIDTKYNTVRDWIYDFERKHKQEN